MKAFLLGIAYNFKGMQLGLSTPRLLLLGLLRALILVAITVAAATLILMKYQQILTLMWQRPESMWIAWLWYLASWLLALVLITLSAVAGFLLAQILFSVIIMDLMSQVTERLATGSIREHPRMPWYSYFLHLLRQEIPRATLPVIISLGLLVLSWFTPLGPVLTILSPLAAGLFLAWDNTDLIPARRLTPFRERLAFLRRNFGFHLGFGLLFLVPGLNILLLSFAPVGATLFYVERIDPLMHKRSAREA